MVSRYTWPSEEAGREPTRSTCTWENLRAGMGMACRGAAGCLCTFPLWHCWHSRHIAATSLPTPFHTKCAVTICLVARMPGCTMWMAWKTASLSASGTSGLVVPHATLHSRLAPSTCTVLTDREEDVAAWSVLGQLTWLAAILWKEMPAAGCRSATPAATPGSESGEEFSLPPCRATT
jgi:hypothetical protein